MKKIVILCLILVIELSIVMALADKAKRDKNNMTEPQFIRTNSLGCSQYVFKGDVFWKCPKELGISSIEETNSKVTEIQPVFVEK